MTRTFTGLCVAAAFGMVASLGAQTGQTTGTSPDPSEHSRSTMSDRGSKHEEVTVTGCLQKGADGNYILTNARVDENEGSSSASSSYHGATGTTSGTTGTSTTAGTTASGTSTGTTASGTTGESSSMGSTWQLEGGKDLEKHVGHKIQVKGHMAMGSSSENEASTGTTGTTAGAMSGTTGTTTGTTAATGTTATSGTTGTTSGTTGTTAGTTGTTATGTTATGTSGTATEPGQMHHGEMGATSASHRLEVKSVKMISTSCS